MPEFVDDGRAINVSWNTNITRITPVDRFVLSWRIETEDRNEEKRERQSIATQNAWYSLTNYTQEALYFFSVIAENEAGSSEPSDEYFFDAGETMISRPQNSDTGSGLDLWIIILIAVCSGIVLLICCLCCCFCLLCCCGERQKVYHAEEEGVLNS